MIYLPLYVLYDYPNIEMLDRRVVFYNIPQAVWYFSDDWNTDGIFCNVLSPKACYGVEMDPPTTYGKTNEAIKKALRTIYQNRLPDRIRSRNGAGLFVSLIDGEKTRRLQIGVKAKSNLSVLGTSYLDIINSDSFIMSHLEIPRYYHPKKYPTVGIYGWLAEYLTPNNTWFWHCGYNCHYRNTIPEKRLVGGIQTNVADYGNKVYHVGASNKGVRLTKITINFEYLSADHLYRVQINARINEQGQIEPGKGMGCAITQTFGIDHGCGCIQTSGRGRFSGVSIPEHLRYEPDETKTKHLVEYIIDRHFDVSPLKFHS